MSKIKFRLKNPLKNRYSDFYLDSLISQIKPLSPKSVLVVGRSNQLLNRLKKIKYSSIETADFNEKLEYKSNSFDLVICAEKLTEGNKKMYKEALRVSRKYVWISWNLNLNSILGKDHGVKIIKIRGVKILSKKLLINKNLVVIRKLG